jgi:hypothetical protein
MTARPAPLLQAMLITTGSGTSAKQGRLRSNPSARRLTRKLLPGQRVLRRRGLRRQALRRRELRRRELRRQALRRRPVPVGARGPRVARPVVGRQMAGRQPTVRLVVPMAGAAARAACCRAGALRQGRRRLIRKLARSPLMCQPAAASEVPLSTRALATPVRSRDCLSRAGRGTRTPPLTRRPPRCRPALRGQGRAGRRQTIAGRGPVTSGRSPVAARPCRSRARHGRCQDQLQPAAVRDKRRNPVRRGQPRRGPTRRGSRRRSGLGGLLAIAGRNVPAAPLPPHSSAPPLRRRQRRQ